MTQVEFEIKLVDLKNQKRDALAPIHEMLGGVKEKISAVDRQIKDLRAKREELNQQRIIISNKLQQQQKQWYDKIASFTTENFSETRTLENISDWTIAKELHRRGFTGILAHLEKEGDFIDTMNKNLNGSWSEGEVKRSQNRKYMLNEKIKLSMCQLPNGYAVDIGKRKYMFCTVEDLLTGLFFHLGLQEYEYVDKNEIQALMQSISVWQTQKQAFKAASDMMQQNKELMHKLRIAQATISGLRKKCDALRERIESRKK